MKICVFEDAGVANLEPLTLTRAAFDLRVGATSLLAKQERAFAGTAAGAVVRPDVVEFCRLEHPELSLNSAGWLEGVEGAARVALVNARWLPGAATPPEGPGVGLVGDEVAYVVLPAAGRDARPTAAGLNPQRLSESLEGWRDALPRHQAAGRLIAYPWDLVESNAPALEEDFRAGAVAQASRLGPGEVPAGLTLAGPADRLRVDPSARVEPFVLIDTTKGPVTIDRGALVQAFSRLEGPCYVGPRTQVLAARVRGSSLGPDCRVGGEVEASILHGHANKAHDGFLGHSYLGEWVNLGAGTQTSDLRTDYGTVRFHLAGRPVDSGLIKVGAFVGDHAKTSLGALFNTGSLVGPFALLLATGTLLPRSVPAFCQVAQGRIQERTDLREMFATAAVVMARRDREWTPAHAEACFLLYEATAAARRQALRESEQRRLRRVV
jgi:UDP-N-acetylglucosamine diphosphorylase/glucosamine-1-phosphate N-acetyltransferase